MREEQLIEAALEQMSSNGYDAGSFLTADQAHKLLSELGLVLSDEEMHHLMAKVGTNSKLQLKTLVEWVFGCTGKAEVERERCDAQMLRAASLALGHLSAPGIEKFLLSLTPEEQHACALFCRCVSRSLPQLVEDQQVLEEPKRTQDALRSLPLFVLDNSIRETTVAQPRGHTLQDKRGILGEVKRCGFRHVIVGAFTSAHRVDDEFAMELRDESSNDDTEYYGFSEVCDRKLPDQSWDPEIPVGLKKMKDFGICNVILELDLTDMGTDYEIAMAPAKLLAFVRSRLQWILDNMSRSENSGNPKVFVNFRDLCPAMLQAPARVRALAEGLAQLPEQIRPFGLIFEDPSGGYLPEELGRFVQDFRSWWPKSDIGGHLLVHFHKNFALEEAGVLSCLSHGADGIWCAVAAAGAQMGHACSTITITNLVRAGNEHVKQTFKCDYLRTAAREVTRLATGEDPSPTQEVYGARSSEWVFDFGGMGGAACTPEDRQLILSNAPVLTRIHTLSSEAQLRKRLTECFGEQEWDDIAIGKMKEVMLSDLREGRKEEYMSAVGIAFLYQAAGASITKEMHNVILQGRVQDCGGLLQKVKEIWNEESEHDVLSYRSFYDLFMGRYFGCFPCEATQVAFQVFDLNDDGRLRWSEFEIWLRWALQQYPKQIQTVDQLLDAVFEHGLLPDMQAFVSQSRKLALKTGA